MSTYEEEPLAQTPAPAVTQDVVGQDAVPERMAVPYKERIHRLAISMLTWESLAWLTLAVTAFLTRFWNLGTRVMSHDESEHVYFSWLLSKGSGYSHNPMMHGPLLFELTALFDSVFKATDFTARLVPALLGIAIVVIVPLLLRPWLGRLGALVTSALFLVSPYVLYYSRYNRHDIYEISFALIATFAILSYLREWENRDEQEDPAHKAVHLERWLLLLAGAEALMFSAMETAFFYLAIFAGFLFLRMLVHKGLNWKRFRYSAEFDLLIVLATLGAFFSSPIVLLIMNPIWNRLSGHEFVPLTNLSSFGIAWSSSPYGLRIWGLMVVFWWAASVVGVLWDWRRWIKLALLFLGITFFTFTTAFTNWSGIGTGFVGSLGYWLSQQGVARGSQPWYYYFIVFPLYEYLPIIGGFAAFIYFAFRRRFLSQTHSILVLYTAWWALWIFVGLSIAGEKMPWLSTHITVPFILLTGWFIGQLLVRGLSRAGNIDIERLSRPVFIASGVAFIILFLLTARTSFYANYINYDSVVEFVDYAHGAPGVNWTVADINQAAAHLGQGNAFPVAFDSANAWPLTWYLRDHPGFYGDQPNRAELQNDPVIIAGQQNWQKIESFLGPDYNRYDVIRIWWPMEDYKNLSWDRIRGVMVDPQMRQAVWNILWSRDYSLYAKLTKETLNPPADWPLQDRMRVYIRKDVAAQIPDLKLKSSQMADIPPQVDEYASKRVNIAPIKMVQPQGLNGPRNFAFAPDGSVYVVDTGNSRIVHIDPQGQVLATWGGPTAGKQTPPAPGTFNAPWGAAVDSQGNVYVADTWNHRIQKFDANGKFLLQWGSGGVSTDGPDLFWGPRDIAIGPNGNLYITDTGNRRVAVYNPLGKFQFEFSKDGEAQLDEPVGIAVDKDGRVFIADTWNMRVAIFDAQGKFLSSWPVKTWNGTSVDEKPYLALDSQGRVYLSDPEGSRVLVFSTTGDPLAVFGEFGTGSNELNLPTGLVTSPSGEIWVADAGNNRLVAYPPLK